MSPSGTKDVNQDAPVAVVTYAGRQFRLTHDDPADHIFSILQRTGRFYESDMLQALAAYLQPGDRVIDVGANIGNHAVFFAAACECDVVAFEPNPRAIRSLRANLEMNGVLKRAKIKTVAVGAKRQRGTLVAPAEHNLGTAAVDVDSRGDVEMTCLDDAVGRRKVTLIKIDIEGKDAEVLKGARKLLGRHHPAIVIEAKSPAEYEEVARLLDPLGYVTAGSFNYTPTHLFLHPSAGPRNTRRVPDISHRLALQYIDSMSRQSGVDQRLGRMTAAVADIASRNQATQADLTTQRKDSQRLVDDVGVKLSSLAQSLQVQTKGIDTHLAVVMQQATAAAENLATLKQDAAGHAAANVAATAALRAAIETMHDRQSATDKTMASMAAATDTGLVALRQGVSADIAVHAAANDKTTAALRAAIDTGLVALRRAVSADIAGQAAANVEATAALRAAIEAMHDRQAEADSTMASMATDAAAGLEALGQQVSRAVSGHAAVTGEAIARQDKSIQALNRKMDAVVETTLLSAASVESDLGLLRKELADLVDHRLRPQVAQIIAENLRQLQTDIARSIGRHLGDVRIDLQALFGNPNMSLADAVALLGIDTDGQPPQDPAPPGRLVDRNTAHDRRREIEAPSRDERRTWHVRREVPRVPAAESAAHSGPDEQLARFDFDRGWKDQAWKQRGSELRPGSLVVAVEDGANLGFVTRQVDCPGGGLLEIEASTDTIDGAPGGRVLLIRTDAGEPIGHDFPLAEGTTRIRAFAPSRTRKIKIYILKQGGRLDDAFRVPAIVVKRISADQHQLEVSRKIGQPVFASMASIPSRREMLRDCVDSLILQCDRVRVFLNGYPDVPGFLEHPRIEVRRSQDWDDRGDAGKFFWIDRDEGVGGYRLIVDDDILFPPDFATTMTAKVASTDDKSVFSAHGILLRQPIKTYYDTSSRATTFRFWTHLQADQGVHIGGTGAMCFHSDAVNMRHSDFKYVNSADVWLALYAQANGLAILTPARPNGWIRANRQAQESETIYDHSLKRTRSRFDSSLVQDAVLRRARRLTLQVRGRTKCGFALYVTNVDSFAAAIRSWLTWRSLDVEWVVLLAYERGNADIEAAVRSLDVPHEVHLLEVGRDLPGGVAAFLDEIGVEAALCAGDAIRFVRPAGQDIGSSAPPAQDALGAESLVPGRTASRGRLAIQPLQGVRSGQTQAFVVGRTKDRLSWMGDLLGNAALGRAGSPLDADFSAGFMRAPRSNRTPVPARAGSAAGLNDFFERVLVLNLDRRPDRWAAVSRQFECFGIRAERMAAVDGLSPDVAAEYEAYRALPLATVSGAVRPVRYDTELYLDYDSQQARLAYLEGKSGRKAVASAGAWGYLRSYERLLERALVEQTESLIVFDDDAVLHNDFQSIFADAVKQLPSDWLIVQLGTLQYSWSDPWAKWLSPRLYRTNGSAVGSHAVGMRFDIYPFLLDHVRRMDMPFDIGALSAATRAFPDRCFVIYPNLAIQRLADSDIGTSDFQQGRSIEEIAGTYRWNLADYGL